MTEININSLSHHTIHQITVLVKLSVIYILYIQIITELILIPIIVIILALRVDLSVH